jgi:hypothetical protein
MEDDDEVAVVHAAAEEGYRPKGLFHLIDEASFVQFTPGHLTQRVKARVHAG